MATTESLCRLCLRHDDNLENLLDSNPNDLISRALEDIFRIKVSKTNGKPNKICQWCKDKLVDFYIFYLRVENNEKKMDLDGSFLNIKVEPSESKAEEVRVKTEPSRAVEPQPTPYDSDDDDIIFVGEVENKTIDLNAEENSQIMNTYENNDVQNDAPELEENAADFSMTTEIEVDEKKCFIDAVDTHCQVIMEVNVNNEKTKPKDPILIPKFNNMGEKLMFLKKHPDMSDSEMIKVFYELQCENCEMDLEFKTFDELADHNRLDHKIEITKIMCCGVSLIKAALSPHVKHHMGLGKTSLKTHVRQLQTHLICEECGDLFVKEFHLLNHLQTSHGQKLAKRSQNKRSTALPSYLTQKPTKIHCCDICGKSFGENRSLELHKLMHQQPQSEAYTCDVCDAKFTKKFFMQRHKEVNHLKILRYECETCGEKFGWPTSLKAHVHEKHSPEKIARSCDICERPFNSMKDMRKHRLSHMSREDRESLKKFECDLCDRKYIFKCELQKHICLKHLNMYKYKATCDICGKVVENRALSMHRASHLSAAEREAQKKFTCKYCERKFWFQFQVKAHIKTMHECKACLKRFKFYKVLGEHMLKEHGIKQFNRSAPRAAGGSSRKKCEFCEKTFKSADYYKSHLHEWHLGGFAYECKECPYKANYRNSFKEHCKKVHNISDITEASSSQVAS